jgi:hypothetical protein
MRWKIVDGRTPGARFHSAHYWHINQRRQEHLATLGLPIAGKSVLEVGAGIGDHTSFFLDRGCKVCVTEPRPENLRELRRALPGVEIRQLDLDAPDPGFDRKFDIVYNYGTLYHLRKPAEGIAYLAPRCAEFMLLETCVSVGEGLAVNLTDEARKAPSQAFGGTGCRPTRGWIVAELKRYFAFVYMTATQPWHAEFPIDWTVPAAPDALTRAVFVASHGALTAPDLLTDIPLHQRRH